MRLLHRDGVFYFDEQGKLRRRVARDRDAGSSSLLRSTGGTPDAAPLASHWRVQARLCFSIRPSVQTRMAAGQVGVQMIFAAASKFVSCARFMGMRTLGRFEG